MTIAIIDDCLKDRKNIEIYLKQYFKEHKFNISPHISYYKSAYHFMSHFKKNKYELIFLDDYIEDLNGLELAKMIRKIDTQVALVFVSGSCEFAIDAYKVKATDYLIKPCSYEQLCTAMNLLNLKQIEENQFLLLNSGQKNFKIFLKDIIYCDSCGHYTQIHKTDHSVERIRQSFCSISKHLEHYAQFYHCYRGCIINMNQIIKMESMNFLLSNGERIPFRKKDYLKAADIYTAYLSQHFERNFFEEL